MEALTSCLSTKIFARSSNITISPSSTLAPLGPSNIGFSRSLTFKKLHVHGLPTIAKSHVASEVLIGLENAATGLPNMKTEKTIHVKFQLQKKCKFGEQFLLVGDDPMLGLWNPENAIPMNWSDGHIWNAELVVPIESTIQYKFILKQVTGEILWQPGPDRIFKSWENNAGLIVSEDWEDPEAQKIMEEPVTVPDLVVSNQNEEQLLLSMNNGVALAAELGSIVAQSPFGVDSANE